MEKIEHSTRSDDFDMKFMGRDRGFESTATESIHFVAIENELQQCAKRQEKSWRVNLIKVARPQSDRHVSTI